MQHRFGTLLKCFPLFLVRPHIASPLANIESLAVQGMRNHQSLFLRGCWNILLSGETQICRHYKLHDSNASAGGCWAVATVFGDCRADGGQNRVSCAALVPPKNWGGMWVFASKELSDRLGRLYPFEFALLNLQRDFQFRWNRFHLDPLFSACARPVGVPLICWLVWHWFMRREKLQHFITGQRGSRCRKLSHKPWHVNRIYESDWKPWCSFLLSKLGWAENTRWQKRFDIVISILQFLLWFAFELWVIQVQHSSGAVLPLCLYWAFQS